MPLTSLQIGQLLVRVGKQRIGALKLMPREVGERWIIKTMPFATPDERELLLNLTLKPGQQLESAFSDTKFRTIAWLCGASYGLIADWANVSRATVVATVKRDLMKSRLWHMRADMRPLEQTVGKTGKVKSKYLTPSELSTAYQRYLDLGPEITDNADPVSIAEMLRADGSTNAATEVEPNDLEPVPDRKIEPVTTQEFMRRAQEVLAKKGVNIFTVEGRVEELAKRALEYARNGGSDAVVESKPEVEVESKFDTSGPSELTPEQQKALADANARQLTRFHNVQMDGLFSANKNTVINP